MHALGMVGLGPLGRRVATDAIERGLGRVLVAVDPAPELAGRPLPDLVPGAADVPLVATLDEVVEPASVDAWIVATSSDLERCADTFRWLLGRGAAVVSTCEELSWPWLRHPERARELEELAAQHGGRLLGTGVNPGFLMDALPVAATTACASVHAVRIERIQDAAPRRLPFQRKIGATLAPEAFEARVREGTLRHVGLGESLHLVADALGVDVARWEETIEPVLADGPQESGLGPIRTGQARGVRQVARGWVDGEDAPRFELVFQASIGEPHPRDAVHIDGDPPIELTIPGGVHGDVATSAIVLNSVRSLLAAAPGLHTVTRLPLRGCASR